VSRHERAGIAHDRVANLCFSAIGLLDGNTISHACAVTFSGGATAAITGSEQQLRLMRSQCLCRFVSCWPPLETAF
jgi:hypothetical protein